MFFVVKDQFSVCFARSRIRAKHIKLRKVVFCKLQGGRRENSVRSCCSNFFSVNKPAVARHSRINGNLLNCRIHRDLIYGRKICCAFVEFHYCKICSGRRVFSRKHGCTSGNRDFKSVVVSTGIGNTVFCDIDLGSHNSKRRIKRKRKIHRACSRHIRGRRKRDFYRSLQRLLSGFKTEFGTSRSRSRIFNISGGSDGSSGRTGKHGDCVFRGFLRNAEYKTDFAGSGWGILQDGRRILHGVGSEPLFRAGRRIRDFRGIYHVTGQRGGKCGARRKTGINCQRALSVRHS